MFQNDSCSQENKVKEEWNVKGEAEFIAKFSDRLSNSIQIDSPLHCNFLKDRLKGRQAKQFRPILWITLTSLKGQCHGIFSNFFYRKNPPGPHMNRQKKFCKLFHFCKAIHKNLLKKWVSLKSLTLWTWCQHGH